MDIRSILKYLKDFSCVYLYIYWWWKMIMIWLIHHEKDYKTIWSFDSSFVLDTIVHLLKRMKKSKKGKTKMFVSDNIFFWVLGL